MCRCVPTYPSPKEHVLAARRRNTLAPTATRHIFQGTNVATLRSVTSAPFTNPRTSDAIVAVRNTLKLGSGLIATWCVSLGVRIFLPRFLGPENFGPLSFAEAFTTAFFVLATLGVDTYIRTEIPLRSKHGDDFFGGILAIRLLMTAVIVAAIAAVLWATHRPPELRRLVYVFAAAQSLVVLNETLAAFLHARCRVGGLAGVNVAAKVVWAAGIAVALARGGGLIAIGAAYVVAEAAKAALLFRLCRRHLDLHVRLDWTAAWAVVLACTPFYVNYIARNVYSRIDVSLLEFTSTNIEVGWYAAANVLANVTLLITPVFNWVLLPLFARAAARSDQDLTRTIHRSLEAIQAVTIPVALMLGLGADIWVGLVFGKAYAPAALSLKILAPLSVLTYVATVGSQWLVVLQRPWRVTVISLVCTLVNPVLVLGLIGPCSRRLGPGGAGAGCALAQFATEVLVTSLLMAGVGRRAVDRSTLTALGKSLAACGAAVLVDRFTAEWGAARLALDLVAYLCVVLLLGAIRLRDTAQFARLAFQRHEIAS
jgi:O-antigen/teichoic acid export membrane protein